MSEEEPKAKKAKTEEEEKEKREEKEEKHEEEDVDEKVESKPAANGDKKESLFDISSTRRVSVRKFKGKTYIDIREVRRIIRYEDIAEARTTDKALSFLETLFP